MPNANFNSKNIPKTKDRQIVNFTIKQCLIVITMHEHLKIFAIIEILL